MVQDNVKDDEGRNLRPDVIVKGADGTRIIIDSKVSLTAYSDYVGAEDDDQRKAAIKANHESIWKHVEELSKKTISQKTHQEDEPPSPSQILNEWLNGEEQDNGN